MPKAVMAIVQSTNNRHRQHFLTVVSEAVSAFTNEAMSTLQHTEAPNRNSLALPQQAQRDDRLYTQQPKGEKSAAPQSLKLPFHLLPQRFQLRFYFVTLFLLRLRDRVDSGLGFQSNLCWFAREFRHPTAGF